ncbi:MAG TPA: DUF2520 domain-containing protein [bacterium]|nr:DUF2520 domain-containing protein [bacterium]
MVTAIYIAGRGRVGAALVRHFGRQAVPCRVLKRGWEKRPPRRGVLFLAVPDAAVERICREVFPTTPKGLTLVHFAGGLPISRERTHLLHPFASMGPESEFGRLWCLWHGPADGGFERFLNTHHFHVIRRDPIPGPGYHVAAVLAGNFPQYLFLAARDLLRREGFSDDDSKRLLVQLVETSVLGVREGGVGALTGPAARGDRAVMEREIVFLGKTAPRLAVLYRALSELIAQAVGHGKILD